MKKVVSLMIAAVLLLCCFTVTGVSVSAVAKPIPGYYVVGTMNNWTLDKNYLMQPSYFGNHYALLQFPLNAGDELKVVYSDDGLRRSKWYPQGTENNFIVQESCEYYNIELAPDCDGVGDQWYEGCIYAMTCPPPIDTPDPTVPEYINHTKSLWESGAELTAADIEEAVNDQLHSQKWIPADQITVCNARRFDCTPAYIVDYEVEGYGIYLTVIQEEILGDYLFYSTSSYQPHIFIDDTLYPFTKAYQEGILTDEMLRELVEAGYKGGNGFNGCKIVTRNITGDADGDGRVTVVDALYVQRYAAKMIDRTAFYEPLSDVDHSGDANVVDALWVQRHVARMCDLNDLPL